MGTIPLRHFIFVGRRNRTVLKVEYPPNGLGVRTFYNLVFKTVSDFIEERAASGVDGGLAVLTIEVVSRKEPF